MEDDDFIYRQPVSRAQLPQEAPVSYDEDERHFSTLIEVYKEFKAEIDKIDSVHVFELLKNYPEPEAKANLLRQIEVEQGVYDRIKPLFDKVESAIRAVKTKRKDVNP